MADEREKPERRSHVQQRLKRVHADTTLKHLEQLTKQARALNGEDEGFQEDEQHNEFSLESIRSKVSVLHSLHARLRHTLSKPEKHYGEKLVREFEKARESGDYGTELLPEHWDDHQFEAVFQQSLHEANAENEADSNLGRPLYLIGRKTIFILSGGRVGVQFDTYFQEKIEESYYCVISLSQRRLSVNHNFPFYLPMVDLEKCHLSQTPTLFIARVENFLQAYVSRRGQVQELQDLYGEKVKDLYYSCPYNLIEFSIEESNWYDDLESDLPKRSEVKVWPLWTKSTTEVRRSSGRRGGGQQHSYSELAKAEDVLRKYLLHEAFDEVVREIQEAFGSSSQA